MDKIIIEGIKMILDKINSAIHVVDSKGITIFYNSGMESIEGLTKEEVMGKYLLSVFTNFDESQSSLLQVMKTKEPIYNMKQMYINIKGKRVVSENYTYPILINEEVLGAIEIANNLTGLSNLSEKIVELNEMLNPKPENKSKIYEDSSTITFDKIIGKNKKFLEAVKVGIKAATSTSSVIIYGETGTGKELFARSIHNGSSRRNGAFIAINCAAIPENLLESILFGTTKGSFTGAVDRMGLFEQANNGTLFLDEINSMSYNLQSKLLRVLQESYLRRVGGLKDIKVDVRIIAATNENPKELVEKQILRKDLYYRLNVMQINILALRERKDDIKLLVNHFLKYYNEKLGTDIWIISSELMALVEDYNWPGNVRELQNFIEASINMTSIDDHVISINHVPNHILENIQSNEHFLATNIPENLNEHLSKVEKEILKRTLIRNKSNISKSAIDLGISRQNLQYKIKLYKLEQ
jgi:arginine utilization regulatory protein